MGDTDHVLRGQVERVENLALRIDQNVGQVEMRVANVGRRTDEAVDRLQRLEQTLLAYMLESQRTANVQLAQTRVGITEARLANEFGHYKVVRRVARGMLEGFDLGLVSDDVMREAGEQLVMETPGYWLAPMLVGLRAWLWDDPDRCRAAMEEAFRRSPAKTSLFMALTLRRQGRGEGSVRWLRHYLAALDPSSLGREFAVVLESVSHGAFGPSGVALVQERLDVWRAQLLQDESRQVAQVARWRAELERYLAPSSAERYPRLVAVSPQWPQMDEALRRAGAHEALIRRYAALGAAGLTSPEALEDQVDDILDRLVTGYDEEELPLRREHAQHEAVIRNGGDLAAAQRDLDTDLLALDRTLDYLTIQTESALAPEKLGVSDATQRMAVSSCHEWFSQAHQQYSLEYRQGLPANVDAVFEGSHNAAGTVFQLPRWVGSFTQPVEALERSLATHWDQAARPFIDGLAYRWGTNLIAPIAVTLTLILCTAATRQPVGILIALLVGGGWGLFLWSRAQSAASRQAEVRQLLDRAKQDSLQQLRAAGAEVVDWTTDFQRADGRAADVRTMIADLATAGGPATPYERRVAGAAERSLT
ncbi:hypothetical protein [Actinoplanes sp. NPDC049265]|uniref:hypothetical protein n=1 Tax=Actinoplanes sp. NPDC049265 TaxID=3363902 RepID=UPI00371B2582